MFAKTILDTAHIFSLSLYKLPFAKFFVPKDVWKASTTNVRKAWQLSYCLPSANRDWSVTSRRDRKTLQSSGIMTVKITKANGHAEEVFVATFWAHAVQQFVENVGLLRP
jgi:hypothetical protein